MVRAIFRYAVLLAIVVVVGLVVFVALTYPRFQADVQPNRERLLSESDVLTTEGFGDIEYAVQREGLPVLLVHGAGGGWERRRNAAKAGRSKPSSEIRGVKTQLQELTDRVLSGVVERADAAVCGQLLNVKLRALEQERRWREIEELEERLEAVEGVLKGREKRTSA